MAIWPQEYTYSTIGTWGRTQAMRSFGWSDFAQFATDGPLNTNPARNQMDTGHLTPQDKAAIIRALKGEVFEDHTGRLNSIKVGHTYNNMAGTRSDDDCYTMVYTAHGSASLLWRWGLNWPFVVDMDKAKMITDERMDDYRSWIFDADTVLHGKGEETIPIIPVGLTALMQGAGVHKKSKLALIHRQGNESVFTIDGKPYLSGYDEQESPPLYFLCQLPAAVETVDEAREALKPKSVLAAEAAGKRVLRQGDLFFIETDYTDERNPTTREKLYGTAHVTQTVTLDSGLQFARGKVEHQPWLLDPNRTTPDHSPLELGDKWWAVAKNTVPITGASETRVRRSW